MITRLYLLLLALVGIWVYHSFDKKRKEKEKENSIEDKQKEKDSNIAFDDPVPTSQQSVIKKLKDLHKLKEAGIITDEEAELEKRKILNKPTRNEP